jgi:ATP-dependent protease ClpP protease subunit
MEYSMETNNKRKYMDEHNEYFATPVKKQKVLVDDNLIYSIGKEIHFTAGVDKFTIEKLIKLITKIVHDHETKHKNDKKKMNITIVVDSPGGSVHSVLKFVDFIKLVKNKYPHITFTSIATGFVASAGTIMCVVADKRLMTPHAHAMIHELSSGNTGKYTHMMSYSKHLTDLHNVLLDIYMKVSKVPRNEMEVLLNTESWYSAEEYKKLGLVDDIATDIKI